MRSAKENPSKRTHKRRNNSEQAVSRFLLLKCTRASQDVGKPVIVIPARLIKKAVRRNYIRRVLRESVRAFIKDQKAQKCHMFISLRRFVSKKDSGDLRKDLTELLAQLYNRESIR